MTTSAGSNVAGALQRAELLNDLRRYPEAKETLSRALGTDPSNALAWCLMSQACYGLREFDGALAAANNARKIDPDSEWAHRLASLVLSSTGCHWEAVEAATEAVRIAPFLWQTHARLAGAYASGGWGLENAAASADQAVALSPHEPDAHMAVGAAALLRRDLPGAKAAYERVIALNPEHSRAHTELARIEKWTNGVTRPSARARTLANFVRAVRVDPRGNYNRDEAERTITDLLNLYALFVVADLSVSVATDVPGVSVLSRVVMALGIAPAAYFAAFWARLTPDVKTYVRQFLRTRREWVAALALSTLALAIGAVAPGPVRLVMGLFVFCAGAVAYMCQLVRRELAAHHRRKWERKGRRGVAHGDRPTWRWWSAR